MKAQPELAGGPDIDAIRGTEYLVELCELLADRSERYKTGALTSVCETFQPLTATGLNYEYGYRAERVNRPGTDKPGDEAIYSLTLRAKAHIGYLTSELVELIAIDNDKVPGPEVETAVTVAYEIDVDLHTGGSIGWNECRVYEVMTSLKNPDDDGEDKSAALKIVTYEKALGQQDIADLLPEPEIDELEEAPAGPDDDAFWNILKGAAVHTMFSEAALEHTAEERGYAAKADLIVRAIIDGIDAEVPYVSLFPPEVILDLQSRG